MYLFGTKVCVKVCPSTFYRVVDKEYQCVDACSSRVFQRENINVTVGGKTVTVENFECKVMCDEGLFLN